MLKEAPNNYKIKIEVTSKKEGLCKTGVPFPKGKVNSLSQIKLRQNGHNVEGFARPLCYWCDGSIKWISLGFFHMSIDSNQYDLMVDFPPYLPIDEYAPSKPNAGLQLVSDKKKLTVSTVEFQFILDFGTLSLSAKSSCGRNQLFKVPSVGGMLSRSDKQQVTAKFKQWNSRTFQNLSTGLIDVIELEIDGYFEYQTDKQPLQFTTLIEFYRSAPFIKIETTLHNPNPAKHSGGVWDLGDEGSELFDSFIFDLALAEKERVQFKVSPSSKWQLPEPNTRIVQRASGGENWQSPVHLDKNNQLLLETNGFEVLADQAVVDSGERAAPILYSTNGIGLTVDRFWQNFPAAIGINDSNVEIELFPSTANGPHELQGGERKTHIFWLSLSSQIDSLNWVHSAAIAKPSNDWITKCAALPTFLPTNETAPIATLIKVGLDHTQGFFAKREMIDEYGWRNFGELYADHETAGYQGTESFVSHYNNQYDPIYGLIRQFLLTGDDRWFELADDLAKHVKDIDIYHTEGDKPEYNAGLFWHTDHYLKACTATHRSFSKLQESGAYEDHAGGGGPGGQHCYTTGLTYHYLLTGSEDSKRVVLALGKWITYVYEGTNTCLELLLAIKNRNRIDLKNHFSGQYPFDRGTANYVIALLDCYQLTEEEEYLLRVEDIIHNTVHPEDDINDRNLQDVEERWFYTVFLQAICRYLQTKEEIASFDDAFYYARDALLHYADWMLSHEYPYLDKPGILEFPNDAWVAQEPRKTHILAAAFYYSPDYKQEYLDKAKFFHEYVGAHLSTSSEASYTRTLVLLMQNQGPLQYYALQQKAGRFTKRRESWPKADYKKASNNMVELANIFCKRLLNLSIAGEINWLKTRFLK